MAIDVNAPLDRILLICSGLTGVRHAYKGVPVSIQYDFAVFGALNGGTVEPKASGSMQTTWRYIVTFVYRTTNEGTAETALLVALAEFVKAIYDDLRLAGTVRDTKLDMSLTDSPQYQTLAGQEFRLFPVGVTVKLDDTFNLPQP